MALDAPFPYFGGKRRVADKVWQRFGDVDHYIEPFCGSAAVLLRRPGGRPSTAETINDISGWITNFWRAVKWAPQEVAEMCEWPVNELDQNSRRDYLQEIRDDLVEKLRGNPEFYDVRAAAWWCHGACTWIGDRWPDRESDHMPYISHTGGKGVTSTKHRDELQSYFRRLHDRLKHVRVLCGDWQRCLTGKKVTFANDAGAPAGVFFDPPYPDNPDVYEGTAVYEEVRQWAVENACEKVRVAFCGYEGSVEMPDAWEEVAWKARGGYGNQSDENGNATRERVWFSPSCKQSKQQVTFT